MHDQAVDDLQAGVVGVLEPGGVFTLEILDCGVRAVVGYISILEGKRPGGWSRRWGHSALVGGSDVRLWDTTTLPEST
jgi:hypothetical protein